MAGLDGTIRRDMQTGYVWYSLPKADIDQKQVGVSLCFYKGVLHSLQIELVNPELYGSSWDDMTEEKQRLCAKHTEDWLRAMGYPTGSFPWGTVWAVYDSKAGLGYSLIRYKT